MKALLKNWLLFTKNINSLIRTQGVFIGFLCFSINICKAQTINYVSNGGFEECGNCVNYIGGNLLAKYWIGLDSTKYSYSMYSELPPGGQVPQIGFAWQWPKEGNNYIIGTMYLPSNTVTPLSYPRNILKENLKTGKTYCVKFYCNISNQSSCGIDGIGAYFGDTSLDTITNYITPLSYLTPQISSNMIITDTLNWVLVSGTLTATGNEKYMVLGNFKNYAVTNTVLINPTNLPTLFTDFLFDDVSCIELDLPADAGADYYLVPGDSAFIGRQPDVGINEACTWYQLPNMTTPFDTIAGLYVKPSVTTSYVVRQEICGLVKWDTVTVFQSAVGFNSLKAIEEQLSLYPVPAQNALNLEWGSEALQNKFNQATLVNGLGQTCVQSDLYFTESRAQLNISSLPNGLYLLNLKGEAGVITKRFVIER